MTYPNSPFDEKLQLEIFAGFQDDDEKNLLQKWLCTSPKITSYRINSLKTDSKCVIELIQRHVGVTVEKFSTFDDTILIHHQNAKKLEKFDNEIIVDGVCGAAVLRGAHIFAPGVIGMMTGSKTGNPVSVYVDLDKKCKKGFAKPYTGNKIFIGNGVVQLERHQLFCQTPQNGIAIEMIETISNCPTSLGDDFLPTQLALLQNLPSIICVRILAPLCNERILDMCASPGNKTTHIAAITKNQAQLVAIDKTPSKIKVLTQRCQLFGAKVDIIEADSTKLVEKNYFPQEFFDRILLDAPCSALGKRPQFSNFINVKTLHSYVPLQRKLFTNAVKLLKKDGILVYSTCTITLNENEGIVAWALKNFDLELESCGDLAGPGLKFPGLTFEQLAKLHRFGPKQNIDSVGFFIAKFRKKC